MTERVIGERYHVLQQLGRGGMGAVYHVRDASSGRELALKQLLLRGSGARTAGATSLFEREFHMLAQLAHPRVIAVYDYGVDAEGPFYTMELLDGGDLRGLAPLEPRRACALMLDVCSSLALLHARRLVHRDITPRNVRCTRDGRAKLIDFGAMVPMGPCSHTVGTPAYVAPEVVYHSTLDARTDLFSLGATLYHALTGRVPFAGSQFSDLREAWATPPLPPSRFVAGIPPALDALCLSLLQIDPAQRPRSAFEVMQRLAAIAGIEQGEDSAVAQAYLATPALVGRDDLLRRFRQRMRRAQHGQGSAMRFEGAPGCGRSRLLDACVLEAKTLGASVLRASAQARADAPFAVVQQLAEQLLQGSPEAAQAAASSADVRGVLFEPASAAPGATPRLRALSDPALERPQLQAALSAWITRVCETHSLLIAIDDAQRIDEASLALLAGLALQAPELRLLLCLSSEQALPEHTAAAFGVLAEHSSVELLPALTREQTQELLASMFGQVPQLALLGDRLYAIALGNPRETLALAQHLVDTHAILYAHGHWTLPADLDSGQLPQTAAQVFVARVAALPPLARQLAQAQALFGGVMRREGYAVLAPGSDARARDAALSVMLAQAVVQSDGEYYSLANQALADALLAQLDPAQKRASHLALYELQRCQPDAHPFLYVHHLLEAEQYELALDLLEQHQASEAQEYAAAQRVGGVQLAATLERALEIAVRLGRPPRALHELRRGLCALAIMCGDALLFARVAPAWRAQLELDSGLSDYRALADAQPPESRLQLALTAAMQRFDALAERERVYRLDEAIQHLALFVAFSLAYVQRTRDYANPPQPELLEPFVAFSPVLLALWHNAIATCDDIAGKPVAALRRWADVYERLGAVQDQSIRHIQTIRCAVAQGVADRQALIGSQKAFEWAARMEVDPQLRVGALHTRVVASLMLGDQEAAEQYGRSAELLALRTGLRPMFPPEWMNQLEAALYLRDLGRVRRVLDGFALSAARFEGWRAGLETARGHLERLAGDLPSARATFARAIALACPRGERLPVWVDAWALATAGALACLNAASEHARAIDIGERALATCEALGVELFSHAIVHEVALAQAQHGLLEQAAVRLEALIEAQRALDMRGVRIAQSYAARARVAIWLREPAGAARYATLALAEPGGDKVLAIAAQGEPLLAEARKAGIDLALAPTEFEASILGTERVAATDTEAARGSDVFSQCPTAEARALRAVEIVCELACAGSGQLYLVDARGELAPVAAHNRAAPDSDAARFARGFFAQQIDDASFTAGLTEATHMLSIPGAASYVDPSGREQRLFMLTCKERGELVYVGLVVASDMTAGDLDHRVTLQLALLAASLLAAGDTKGTRAAV